MLLYKLMCQRMKIYIKSHRSIVSQIKKELVALFHQRLQENGTTYWPSTNIKAVPILFLPKNYYDRSSAFQVLPDFACAKRKGLFKGGNLAKWGTEMKSLLALHTRHVLSILSLSLFNAINFLICFLELSHNIFLRGNIW